MKLKKQALLLAALLTILLFAMGILAYVFIVYVPDQVAREFGAASEAADLSTRILLSAKLFFNKSALVTPVTQNHKDEIFTIEPGETGSQIAGSLFEAGFISDQTSFVDYLVYKGIDRVMQSGVYLISKNMPATKIADSFYNQNPEEVSFAFLPGWRVEEIALLLPSSGISIQPDELINYVKNTDKESLARHSIYAPSLEGYLFPGVYDIPRNSNIEEFALILTKQFLDQLPGDYEKKVIEKGLSIWEAVIIASIIEKETVVAEEAELIAGVFYNRLLAGMPLQSDPTVQYALGYQSAQNTWWKNPLTKNDLNFDSPYNTYLFWGLPPAPICNPGLNSLLAVSNASETEYYYFRSTCDGNGRHMFSRTYEEHLAAACTK